MEIPVGCRVEHLGVLLFGDPESFLGALAIGDVPRNPMDPDEALGSCAALIECFRQKKEDRLLNYSGCGVLRHPFPAAGGEEPDFRRLCRACSPLPLIETVSGEVTVCRMNVVEHWSAEHLEWVVPVAANGLVDKRDAPLGIEPVDDIRCSLQDGGQLLIDLERAC